MFFIPICSLRLNFDGRIRATDNPPSAARSRLMGLWAGRHPPFNLALYHPSDPGADGHAIPLGDGLRLRDGLWPKANWYMTGEPPRLARSLARRTSRLPVLRIVVELGCGVVVVHHRLIHSRCLLRSSSFAPYIPIGRHFLGSGFRGVARGTITTIPRISP